jgi:hypothetical protein
MHRYFPAIVSAFVTFGAACSSSGAAPGDDPSPRRSRNLITKEEIATIPPTTAYDVVREFRQQWLQARGPDLVSMGGRPGPVAAVDNVLRGPLSELETIRSDDIEEIRFIAARDATMRWGSVGVQGGVIEVITRKR